jgi:four helix bundle protein
VRLALHHLGREDLVSHLYRDLIAWQKAKTLTVLVYRLTRTFPREEVYGLTAQMRRAAVSVISNIAEGQGKTTKGEFVLYLGHARGSLHELQSQAEVAAELQYISPEDLKRFEEVASHVQALLNRLILSMQSKSRAAGA